MNLNLQQHIFREWYALPRSFGEKEVRDSRMGMRGDERGKFETQIEFRLRGRVIIRFAFLCQHGFEK